MPADSANKIRKGSYENGKWHVYEFNKGSVTVEREQFFMDSSFLLADGDYIDYTDYKTKKIYSRGQYEKGKKTGSWTYYTREGILCAVETMNADTITSALDYDSTGARPVSRLAPYETDAGFPGGANGWTVYMKKSIAHKKMPEAFTRGYVTGTIWIGFIINEQGHTTDIHVQRSVLPEVDNIICDIIRKSPRWTPAIQHNRRVKSYKRQSFICKTTES